MKRLDDHIEDGQLWMATLGFLAILAISMTCVTFSLLYWITR